MVPPFVTSLSYALEEVPTKSRVDDPQPRILCWRTHFVDRGVYFCEAGLD